MKFWTKKKILLYTFFIVLISSGISIYVYQEENRKKVLEIYIFSLKNSVAYFIRTPLDYRLLINGGPNSEVIRKMTKILPFYSRRIDAIAITNDKAKNVTGLIDILDRYDVGKVYLPKFSLFSLGLASSTDQEYGAFLEFIEDINIVTEELEEGAKIRIPDTRVINRSNVLQVDGEDGMNLLKIDILFPAVPIHLIGYDPDSFLLSLASTTEGFSYSKSNIPSLVFKITYGNASLLFAGELTTRQQKYIGAQNDFKSSVLSVTTNDNPDNFAPAFIDMLHPEYLLFSKSLTSSAKVAQTTAQTKKKKTDPIEYIDDSHRFNVRESEFVKIVSDGSVITIEQIQ